MLSSITPLGERGKGNNWYLTAAAYVTGSLVGGAALGGIAGALGSLVNGSWPDPVVLRVLAGVCVLAAAWDLSGRRVPSWRRQVDESWLQAFRGWVYGLGFGLQLGFGLATIMTSASTWAAVAAMFLAGSTAGGVLIGVAFGLTRGLVLLSVRRVRTVEDLRGFHRRLEVGAGAARNLTIATLFAGGVVAATLGVGP